MSVIDLERRRKERQQKAEQDYCDRLSEGCAIYEELVGVLPYLPKAIILKIMTACRQALRAHGEN